MIDGKFRDDLDVEFIVVQYDGLADFPKEGDGFSPEDVATPEDVEQQYLTLTLEPQTYGNGPLLASSSVAMVPVWPPMVCWDVNGYYRALGVHFLATRKELRRAYQTRNGQASEYLTFVLKKLLDPGVRKVYDLLPLGSLYMDDKYIQERIKKAAFAEASRRSRMGFYTEPNSILIEWGFVQLEQKENSEKDEKTLDLSQESVILSEWVYSFYLWRSAPVDHHLEEWQKLIVSELAARGITINFAVGLIGGEGHLYLKVDENHVFFFDTTNQPNQTEAAQVAQKFKETQWHLTEQ